MVDRNQKKTLWLGVAAVGALVGAALLWHYVNADDDEEAAPEITPSELRSDLEKKDLVNVKRDERGIEPAYFIRLLQFIGETNKARTAGSREKSVKIRREHY